MSWQPYVDTLKQHGNVSYAAFHGHDGNCWASSPELKIKPEEIVALATAPDEKLHQGVFLAGEKYVFVRKDEDKCITLVQLRKGSTGGATVAKTNKLIIVGIYGEKDQGGGCSDSVFKVSEHLYNSGY